MTLPAGDCTDGLLLICKIPSFKFSLIFSTRFFHSTYYSKIIIKKQDVRGTMKNPELPGRILL